MRKLLALIILTFLYLTPSFGQTKQLSDQSEVSLMTCSPVDELYALFGHSAIRVYDPVEHIDLVFNYGTFDFNTENFYIKFAQGKLDYQLGLSSYAEFIYVYRDVEKRSVWEQVLNMTLEERQALFNYLVDFYSDPAKKTYRYDFFYDNCATRVWQAIEGAYNGKLQFAKHEDAGELSHREIIDNSLQAKPWADWGIDLILGSTIDDNASNEELMFLPRYMMEIFSKSTIDRNGEQVPLVKEFRVVNKSDVKIEDDTPWIMQPETIFWGLFVILGLLGYSRFHRANDIVDVVFFEVMGLLGLLVFVMWFFTDHDATKANYNLIWSNPIHMLIPILFLFKGLKPHIQKLCLGLGVFYFVVFLFWIAIPQELNPAFKPMILLLGLRYFFRFRRIKMSRLRS